LTNALLSTKIENKLIIVSSSKKENKTHSLRKFELEHWQL